MFAVSLSKIQFLAYCVEFLYRLHGCVCNVSDLTYFFSYKLVEGEKIFFTFIKFCRKKK